MRTALLLVVVLGGCVAESGEPPAPPVEEQPALPAIDVSLMDHDSEIDVCALAALLPSEDICSLVCDPAAMAERMISDGNDRGACYELYCVLSAQQHVLVGVCLPP